MRKLRYLAVVIATFFVASLNSFASDACMNLFDTQSKFRVFNSQEGPLTLTEWNEIHSIFKNSTFERQTTGEVADHNLAVSLFVADRNPEHIPQVLNENAENLLKILMSPKMEGAYKNTLIDLGENPPLKLHVRRLQGNSMTGSDYNHKHRDDEHDPDFKLGVILYLSDPKDYRGGELNIEGQSIKPTKYSMILFRADVPHEVEEFQSEVGKTRDCIVIILGYTPGPNRRFATATRPAN